MKFSTLLPLLLVFLLAGCDKEDVSLDSTSIDSDILISATETPSPGELILDCRTKREYKCANYEIVSTKQASENSIKISFAAIDIEDFCLTALGPATTRINLGLLPIGEYDLTFDLLGQENNGLLVVSETQIVFEFEDRNGIEILTPVVQR